MIKRSFWERLFPIKRDFYKMLSDQANATFKGVETLKKWLTSRSAEDYRLLFEQAGAADKIRFNMENELIEAFATPFDRQDIYSLSVEMDRTFSYAESTLKEMEAFEVMADPTIIDMVEKLQTGMAELAAATAHLKMNPLKSQRHIENIRNTQVLIDDDYRAGMTALFQGTDLMHALKYREVYHHIKDASLHLGYTTDVLHKIVVRIV